MANNKADIFCMQIYIYIYIACEGERETLDRFSTIEISFNRMCPINHC